MQKKKVLVTGGAGYIGSVLSRLLLDKGYQVRVVDCLFWGKEPLQGVTSHLNYEFKEGDIRDSQIYEEIFKDVDGIVHLAAIVGDPACKANPDLATEINWEASKALFDYAQKVGVERFVFASTCSNYGKMSDPNGYVDETCALNPVSLYAKLKVQFEEYLLGAPRKGMTATPLRFSTAYGPSERMRFDLTVNEFVKEVVLGRELIVFGEQFWRPYCHTQDLADACLSVLEAEKDCIDRSVFNVGDIKENYQKKMIVDLIQERIPEMKVRFVKKDEDPRDYRVNFQKIRSVLGYQVQHRLPDGISELVGILEDGKIKNPDDKIYCNV
ncbi:MAG: NAD(P)-dependent oxidoreductase [Candidatus Omnitrophica bacterium]|nr:NAD(P)-dependent oxidoreductase [Candidatus Omnitrophota bacterium]